MQKKECSVDDDYLLSVMDNMKMTIRGNGKNIMVHWVNIMDLE